MNLSGVKGTFSAEGGNTNSNTVSGNTVDGTNIETNNAIRGGISMNNQAYSNTVRLENSTVGSVSGSEGRTGANNSSVTLENTIVNENVYGGGTFSGTATGNTVALTNSTITGSIYGGYNNMNSNSATDLVTGNTLNLSGANTAGAVQNFATININSATWGTSALTLTGNGIVQNADGSTYATINTQNVAFSGAPTTGTTTLISSTNALPDTLKVFTGATAKATITTAGVVVKQDATPTESKANGVTLAYKNTHTVALAADSKSITYNIANPVSTIALGSIDWVKDGTARTLTTEEKALLTFNSDTAIDKTNFAFTNPLSVGAGESMTLLANATGLSAGDNIAHTQSITKDETNGAKLSATLSGNITRTANTLGYTATGTTLDKIDLADWNGTTAALTGWTPKTGGVAVIAAGFAEPETMTDIFTTDTENFFGTVTGDKAYTSIAFSDTVNGVTLSGSKIDGVKPSDGGKKLTYYKGTNDVTDISLGAMTWGTGRNAGAAVYNYANADIDLSKFTFENPEAISAGSTTLLQANGTLAEIAATEKNLSYTYSPVAGVRMDGAILGSYASSGGSLTYTAAANRANNLTFGNVEWKDTGALLDHGATLTNVSFNGAAVDTSNINFTNIQSLEANKQMTLVASFGDTVGTITGTKYKVGSTLEGEGKASLVGNDLIFTAETSAESMTVQEQTHNTVMSAEVGMAALSAGNDFVGTATEGLAATANVGADGVSSYANMGGGSMRQETGSHIDVHSWNAIIALGRQNKKERGTFEYGAFFEYGRGNYTTHNGDERGDGSTHYTGGGVLAKWTAKHGLYVEGSLRAGSVHDDARNVLRDANGVPYSYETNAPYMGFHLGVGKVIPFDDVHSLDVYGKYFFNRRNGVSFNAGGHYDLDAVTSQVLRVGARYTVKQSKWNLYAGVAYEHELDGKASGTADGMTIRGADTNGGSFRGELGASVTPDKNVPVTLDFNVTGFAGKKQGFSGGVSVAFMF